MKNRPYDERIAALGLWTLEERRNRTDMIEVFKMMRGLTTVSYKLFFEVETDQRTRGNSMKFVKQRCLTSVRQQVFSQRVVNRWNSLDQSTVDSATLNQFKSSLSKWRTIRKGLFMD